jgi:ribosomal protein S1
MTKRIQLGLKQLNAHPYALDAKLAIGDKVKVK